MQIPDGFPGERLVVLPRPLVATASAQPVLSRLLVTDAGYFPYARRHGRTRPRGAAETIVIVVTAGTGWCRMDQMIHVPVNSVLIIPRRTPHSYGATATDPWSIHWFHVVGDDVRDLVESTGATRADPVIRPIDALRTSMLAEQVVTSLGHDETRSSLLAASGAAWHLLTTISSRPSSTRGRSAMDAIEDVQAFLRENLTAPTDVQALARRANLSVSHFANLFRESAGVGVVDYVRRLRMRAARVLLATTDDAVGTIARDVGYADALYFSRQFRSVNGVSPSAYRLSQRAEQGDDIAEPAPIIDRGNAS